MAPHEAEDLAFFPQSWPIAAQTGEHLLYTVRSVKSDRMLAACRDGTSLLSICLFFLATKGPVFLACPYIFCGEYTGNNAGRSNSHLQHIYNQSEGISRFDSNQRCFSNNNCRPDIRALQPDRYQVRKRLLSGTGVTVHLQLHRIDILFTDFAFVCLLYGTKANNSLLFLQKVDKRAHERRPQTCYCLRPLFLRPNYA